MKTGADQANQYSGRNRRRVPIAPSPILFVLRPDLTIYKIYNGWFFVGRPQLRNCARPADDGNRFIAMRHTICQRCDGFPQQGGRTVRLIRGKWSTSSAAWCAGSMSCRQRANTRDEGGEDVFFNFCHSWRGYRTLQAGTPVKFELVRANLVRLLAMFNRKPGAYVHGNARCKNPALRRSPVP